jgi:glycosyltransferase involved in cell wall biosynthesis
MNTVVFFVPHTKPSGGVKRIVEVARVLGLYPEWKTVVCIVGDIKPRKWMRDSGVRILELKHGIPEADVYVTYDNGPPVSVWEKLEGKRVMFLLGRYWDPANEFISLAYDGIMTTTKWLKAEAETHGAGSAHIETVGWWVPEGFSPPLIPATYNVVGTMVSDNQVKRSYQVVNQIIPNLRKQGVPLKLVTFGPHIETVDKEHYHYPDPPPEMIPVIYRMCGIWVTASVSEGLGMPNIEAMASGCAVISTRCQGPMEYIQHGENGLLVDTLEELEDTLYGLLCQPSEVARLSANVEYTLVGGDYYAEAAHHKVKAFLEKILTEKPAGPTLSA